MYTKDETTALILANLIDREMAKEPAGNGPMFRSLSYDTWKFEEVFALLSNSYDPRNFQKARQPRRDRKSK